MRSVSSYFEAMSLGIVILMALFGVVQAEDPYRVVIVGDAPPHLSSIVVGAGESVDMRVVILNVTDPVVAGSSLYLNYDPHVISSISCIRSIYKESNSCKEVLPGRYLIEGYDTFGKYTGDVVVAILRLTANASAPIGISSDLKISGQRLGASLGTPVWGPFWREIETPLESGKLTIGESGSVAGIQVNKTVNPKAGSPSTNVTFNITVSNTGTADLNDVIVTDILPDGMSYVSSSHEAENVSGGVVTWDIGTLLSNSSPVSHELVAHVDQGASGNLVNSVEATGKPELGGMVTSTATANFTALEAGIQVRKIACPKVVGVMFPVTFIILVKNTGKIVLDNVTLKDTLPPGTIFLSSSPLGNVNASRKVAWDLGAMEPQETRLIELVAKVGFRAGDTLRNEVIAEGSNISGAHVSSSAFATVKVDRELNMAYIAG